MAMPSTVPIDQRAGSQLSDPALPFLMVDMARPPDVLAATTSLDCFRTTTSGKKMVSSGLFCEGNGCFAHEILCVAAGPRVAAFEPQKGDYPALWGCRGVFPLLRRKSGLCYTADANSPFEAYIYVR